MAAGLAVLDALAAPGLALGPIGSRARLRWPNDVELDGAKLAGILIEARDLAPRRPRFVVGIGINVRQTRFPAELLAERQVTSLALLGSAALPEDVLAALVPALRERLRTAREAPDALASAYLRATGLAGAPVRLRTGSETVEGIVRVLALGAGLTVETPAGPRVVALEHLVGVELLPPEAPRDASFDTASYPTGGARPASL
jgi:BirA family biotin operon repressor/biotin-[acetyl-CoA-carboxylase] ligase